MSKNKSISNLVLGVWGEIKTAKTTLGLTFPKPLVHFDLDEGYERASWRLDYSDQHLKGGTLMQHFNNGAKPVDILTLSYTWPVLFPGQPLQGYIDLQTSIINDFIVAIQNPDIKTIFIDTGTFLWKATTIAHLERVQRNNITRQNLIQIEYARPNTELKTFFSACKHAGKNLIMTHHVGGVYKTVQVGNHMENVKVADSWDGFNGMGASVDMVVKTSRGTKKEFLLEIETCGLIPAIEGLTIENPTHDQLLKIINLARGGT